MPRESFVPLLTLKRSTRVPRLPRVAITKPSDAVGAIRTLIGDNAYESLITLYLNVGNTIIGYDVATMHDVAAVSVSPHGVFRTALVAGAVGFITAHQHPSGNTSPSSADRTLWRRLREIGKMLEIAVLDNLIVTVDGYYSEMEHG